MVGTGETNSCGIYICWVHGEQQVAKLEERVSSSKMVWNIYGRASGPSGGVASGARTRQWYSWARNVNLFTLL